MVKRHLPGRKTNTGTATRSSFWPRSNRQPLRYSGEDQIDNFSGILAETRSTTSPVLWPRSVRDLRLLRVGDRAWASRIQALLCRKPDGLCAPVYGTSLRRREHDDCRMPVSEGHTLPHSFAWPDLAEHLTKILTEPEYSFTAVAEGAQVARPFSKGSVGT